MKLEIIRDGRPVDLGAQGEIVVTGLANRTTPFIRYNLHDLGQFAARACRCGSPFPLLTRRIGRAHDLIGLDNGTSRTSMDILGRLDRYAVPAAAVILKLVDSIAPQKSGKRLAFVRA